MVNQRILGQNLFKGSEKKDVCDEDMNSYRNQRTPGPKEVIHTLKKQILKIFLKATELGNFYKLNFTSIRERKRTTGDLKQ